MDVHAGRNDTIHIVERPRRTLVLGNIIHFARVCNVRFPSFEKAGTIVGPHTARGSEPSNYLMELMGGKPRSTEAVATRL
ncbi:hypothetical protein ACLOJK_031685 [Asimina triloba]